MNRFDTIDLLLVSVAFEDRVWKYGNMEIFFFSTMFDVFCVEILLVRVINFIHNINLKKNKHFHMKPNLGIIHQNCLSLI